MGRVSQSIAIAAPVVAAALALTLPSIVTAPVTLTGTALYMGGTEHPLTVPADTPDYIKGYVDWANYNFVTPSGLCAGCASVAVYGPNEFWPVTGLDSMGFDASVAIGLGNLNDCLRAVACTVTDPPYTSSGPRVVSDSSYSVFSYSQSGTVASIQKSNMIAHPPTGTVSFVFVSNPNRPNGGVLERFVGGYLPILDVTFNGATVTNSPQPTPLTTVDAVHQYDPVADFPTNPLNALAVVNSLLGFAYEHPEGHSGAPILQGQYQDSTYYLIATDIVPMLRPMTIIPYLGPLLATTLDPPLRVLVETATTGPSTRAHPPRPSTSTAPTRSPPPPISSPRSPTDGTTESPTSQAIPPTAHSTPRPPGPTGWAVRRSMPGPSIPTDRRRRCRLRELRASRPSRLRRQEQKRRQQHQMHQTLQR